MTTLKGTVPFPVTLQTILRSREELPAFRKTLQQLQEMGFWGIELNLPDLEVLSPAELTDLLQEYQLHMTYLATGAYAKARGFSLSSPDPEVRRQSVEGCLANLAYAAQMKAGIILGFFKGGPQEDEDSAKQAFIESLRIICSRSTDSGPILVEATNRKETCVVRTLRDAEEILLAVNDPRLRILPDTYHMNIEETDAMGEVRRLLPLIPNLHISDDNRYFPGLGSLDFAMVLRDLKAMGYQGTLGIEGNTLKSLEEDLDASVQAICKAAASL